MCSAVAATLAVGLRLLNERPILGPGDDASSATTWSDGSEGRVRRLVAQKQ